jgi:hypothetical protein
MFQIESSEIHLEPEHSILDALICENDVSL